VTTGLPELIISAQEDDNSFDDNEKPRTPLLYFIKLVNLLLVHFYFAINKMFQICETGSG
jgi:hypothetical protein